MFPLCTSVTDRAALVDRVLDGRGDQPLGVALADGLDPDAGVERDVGAHLLVQEAADLVLLARAHLPLDPRIHVLGVLAENDDVDLAGLLDRRRRAFVPAAGPNAAIEIELLAERDVQRAEPAAHRRRQRSLDRHAPFADRLQRVLGQIHVRSVLRDRLLAGIDLEPLHLAGAPECLRNGGVEYSTGGGPDVGTCSVALDERDHGPIRRLHSESALVLDRPTRRGRRQAFVRHRLLLSVLCKIRDCHAPVEDRPRLSRVRRSGRSGGRASQRTWRAAG